VVASEVRALAQRSSEAAKEIGGFDFDQQQPCLTPGSIWWPKLAHALEEIVEAVGGIADHVAESLAQPSNNQPGWLRSMHRSTNLTRVTQQNAAMFEETTAASHSLTREAQNLTDMIAKSKRNAASPSRPVFEAITPPGVSPARKHRLQCAGRSTKRLAHVRDHSGGRNMALACSTEVQDDNSWDEF